MAATNINKKIFGDLYDYWVVIKFPCGREFHQPVSHLGYLLADIIAEDDDDEDFGRNDALKRDVLPLLRQGNEAILEAVRGLPWVEVKELLSHFPMTPAELKHEWTNAQMDIVRK